MSHPKIQHYVPQFLLRNFTKGKKKQFFVFDKLKETVFLTNPYKVAKENAFYDIDINDQTLTIEPFLARLEKEVESITRNIIANQSLSIITNQERALLSLFIAVQHLRSTHHRDIIKQTNKGFAKQLSTRGIDPNKVRNFKVLNDEEIKEFAILSLGEQSEFLAPFIGMKDWILLKTTPSRPFVISDNPIALFNQNDFGFWGNIGFGVKGIEIYLPLNDTLSLNLICPSYGEVIKDNYYKLQNIKEQSAPLSNKLRQNERNIVAFFDSLTSGVTLLCEPDNVIHHNSLQIKWSHRWVFSPINDFDLVRRMIKKNESYRYGPKITVQ